MAGTIALAGGGPFSANDELDRRLLASVGADRVVVLPTADAFEEPAALISTAMNWGERLDVLVEAVMVMQRHDAEDPGAADAVRSARAVWLVGDSSMHLRSALKETPVLRRDQRRARGRRRGRGGRSERRRALRPDARPARWRVHARARARPGRRRDPGGGGVERGTAPPHAVARQHAGRRAADGLGARAATAPGGTSSARRSCTASCRDQDSVISIVSTSTGSLSVSSGWARARICWATSRPSVMSPNTT